MKDTSTPVLKKNTFKIPSNIIRIGKVLQFFSPSLATSFITKLFVTPEKHNTPEREEMMRKSAKQEMVHIPSLGHDVMVYTYGYSKTKVLLAHGWSGRGTQMYAIADKLLENGMMIISFDGPAHGLSQGKTTTPVEFVKVIEFLNEKYGPFEFAIGHSFGSICLLKSVSQGLKLDKLVIIGTEFTITRIIESLIRSLHLKPKMVRRLKKKMNNKYRGNIDAYSASESAKDVTIPTLILNDTQDEDVDVSSAYKLRQNLVKGQLLITNGLGHRSILRDKKTINQIVEFIKG